MTYITLILIYNDTTAQGLRKLIAEKADSAEERQWVVCSLADMLRNDLIKNDSVGKQCLTGTPTQLSLIEVIKFKRASVQLFLDSVTWISKVKQFFKNE